MNLDELTLGQIKQLQSLIGSTQSQPNHGDLVGKFCVVRTYSAGVHYGILKSLNGTHAVLENSRNLWRWRGANTLCEVATNGVNADEYSRASEAVPLVALTQAIQIMPATDVARKNLEALKWTK